MKELFQSKKFLVTLVGIVCVTLVQLFVGLPDEVFASLISALCGTYTISQGIADHGKEKAKVEYDV